ncbi:crossover junction ATP-dependent DNA helicase RuvB [Amylolactobacillus amylotrophicus DSM 20534]|uniref:Holliday junction branch migration complex subunit RuvB n=3 Tax=Amylolactobacillus TaxID=2767876 RepID=A0A0R1YQ21_9LACO|nr:MULTISPECIES: Holliday junction branch migration DNA helicase RuvB [Amylolactobacillus]APT18072.1 Holliday junction DNA helicase RuvB [Amylolactobacillus amylophilus DSM 20533 = JCM 1125]KRK37418.1 crossover junction ATP-dependent DNA helicase RuvB [Amylolactobacillus amylotrophicus DSM 20534]KRM42091.1 crossover junction ATP-dependent DNA helicase RuvB [Amylolactobacillus amylophilus DSM 20533 = JCM 1125]GED80568.1 Holliday junction ATP-dependent DNA helicase RuvB [Amylolactobacillus amylop
MTDDRLLAQDNYDADEEKLELSLRPQFLSQYIGQTKVKEEMAIYISAAKKREEALDHVLLYGPPGLGKTTLAMVIANELQVKIKSTSGPAIEKAGDLVALLSELDPGDVLFIDEIHRLPKAVEEVLYSAMEDFYIDIVVGQGQATHPVHVPLPPFTLIGATTRAGQLSAPLRDRFGIVEHMQFYDVSDLRKIVQRTAKVFDSEIDVSAADELARRSRGTPRVSNRLLKRVRDFAEVKNERKISLETTREALDKLQVDIEGLDQTDRRLLLMMINNYHGGPVGIKAIAANVGEDQETIEEVYEPYLLQKGFIKRTQRGRAVTQKAYKHLGIDFLGED